MYFSAAAIRLLRVVAVLALLGLFAIATRAQADDNLLLDGDLTQGSGAIPDHWQTEAWKTEADFTTYHWTHNQGSAGEFEIRSAKPNDARLAQTVHLDPGWYHFTADIRAEEVGKDPNLGGACLSILEDGIVSQQVRGTTNWQTVGLYLKAGHSGADVQVACRLGGYASLNTGKAFCRNIRGVRIDAPPADATFTYDLEMIRGGGPAPPVVSHSSNTALMIVIALATLLVVVLLERRRFVGGAISRPEAVPPSDEQPESTALPPSHPVEEPDREEAADLFQEEAGTAAREAEAVAPREEVAAAPRKRAAVVPRKAAAVAPGYESLDYLAVLAVTVAILCVAILSIWRLEGTPHTVNFTRALDGLWSVLPATGVAALKLWSIWAVSTALVGGLLLQVDPQLDLLDAILAGAAGVWAIACILGQALGPIALFRPITIWILLAAGIFQLWRKPPRLQFKAPTFGQKLVLLAVGLMAIGMLPLELGSPVAPYMDVLSYPASVQRILSFGVYLPFDNDPFGCWGPRTQTPGLELFFAMLAMAGHVKLGVLAQSGLIVPMMALIIFATYRLGLTLANDTAGGMAALFLFFGTIFRRSTGMRGTAVDFALVALGLAFLLDRRRSRSLIAIGALALGTALIVHAIDGGLAIIVAGAGVLLWLTDSDWERVISGILCLAGAVLLAVPEFAIGLAKPIPYPLMPLSQIAGIALILFAVSGLKDGEATSSQIGIWISRGLAVLLIAAIMYTQAASPNSLFEQLMTQFPLLFIFALGGLVVWAALEDRFALSTGAAIAAFALLLAVFLPGLLRYLAGLRIGEAFSSGVNDIGFKLEEYWCPYMLVFPAAIFFAVLYDLNRQTRLVVVAALLAILIYPWYLRFNVNDNYTEHSIAEEWAICLSTAANGSWFLTHDSRWTMGPADLALVDFLRDEQAKGRITTSSHVLHIARDATVMGDFNHFSVFTGINDDPILYNIPATDVGWFAGGRVRQMVDLPEALAEHPPYILEQVPPPSWVKEPPDGYQEVFHQGNLRLFRRIQS